VVVRAAQPFIDIELGICVRQVYSYQGHAVLRTELPDLTTDV
jgi:hypothetical protein